MSNKKNRKRSKTQQDINVNEANQQSAAEVKEVEAVKDINMKNAVVEENNKNKEAEKENKTVRVEALAPAPKKEALRKAERKSATPSIVLNGREGASISLEQAKAMAVSALKVLIPVAAFAVVIAFIISAVNSKGSDDADSAANLDKNSEAAQLTSEPLQENAYEDVNKLMDKFFTALAEGDMDTVVALKDYNDDTTLITYEKRSEYIEEYADVTCYTKPGLEENSYFVYVSYNVRVKDIDTMAPGLNAFYVYTSEDGSLKIDGDMERNVDAAFKLVTNQDDVVDLYNRIDVDYKYAVASDEALNTFMEELPGKVKTSVGVALAQLEDQNDETDVQEGESSEPEAEQSQPQPEEQLQNQAVNQLVKATDTVNVRKSDSEEADRIGKVSPGTELTRIEERINGWSKIIYEGGEAYIKSDYLEVISSEEAGQVLGFVKASTNVNVRSAASQDSEKLGVAQADISYELLQDLGEWYRIRYNGITGYVKAEFFE